MTQRLVDSPALRGGGPERAQPASAAHAEGGRARRAPEVKPVLEINPDHALIARGSGDANDAGVRRLGRAAAGPGAAGRRRGDRRPGGLREALFERVAVEGLRMRSIKGRRSPRAGLTPSWHAGIEGVRRGACSSGGRHARWLVPKSPAGTGTRRWLVPVPAGQAPKVSGERQCQDALGGGAHHERRYQAEMCGVAGRSMGEAQPAVRGAA